MQYLSRLFLLMIVSILLVACSGNHNQDTAEVTADDVQEALGVEDSDADVYDVEAIEDGMGIEKGESSEIPGDIPSDVPLPDDMEIEMTIDNELMAQVRLMTESSVDELKAMYEDYIHSHSDIGDPAVDTSEDSSDYYYISYVSDYDGKYFTILIGYDSNQGDYRTVVISVM